MRDRVPHIYSTITGGVANALGLNMKPKEFMVSGKSADNGSEWIYARTVSIHILKSICKLSIDEICSCSGLSIPIVKKAPSKIKKRYDPKPFLSVIEIAKKIKLPPYYGTMKNTHLKFGKLVTSISNALGYRVTLSEIRSSSRIAEIVRARRLMQWFLLEKGYSLNHIAAITNKDHSSVSRAISDVREIIRSEGRTGDKLMYSATQILISNEPIRVDITPIIDKLLSGEIGKFKAIELIEKEYKK